MLPRRESVNVGGAKAGDVGEAKAVGIGEATMVRSRSKGERWEMESGESKSEEGRKPTKENRAILYTY